ncbi:MAG: hypothetical protein FJY91_01940 [Candidatus Harrisonbacteria bacterium]|nr:hypothetical protein [Candidatus Harrisonbacteria bacterium]
MKNIKPQIDFDEALFEENRRYGRIELGISERVFSFMLLTTSGLIFFLFLRVFYFSVIQGENYRVRAESNVNKEIRTPALRGIIYDRNHEPLLRNSPAFSLTLSVADYFQMKKEEQREMLSILALIFPGEGVGEKIEKFKKGEGGEVVLLHNIPVEQALEAKVLSFPALRVRNDYKREYFDPEIFAHVLGYTRLHDSGQFIVGDTGLEAQYNKDLKGKDGIFTKFRDVKGKILSETVTQKSELGHDLVTTIDAPLQRVFYKAFQEGLTRLSRTAGVGIAINPKTGEILSLVNFPSYNNNEPAKYLGASGQPLFNRALSGVYSPGSTYKPFVALAGLKEGVMKTTDEFYSKGHIEIPNPYFPDKPSRFLDWKPHGWVNLYSALARSSNVYFYYVGGGFERTKGLGIKKLQEWWARFQFGEKTGVDLPAEGKGFFYTPEEKEEKTGSAWRIGDTYNVSIGQGDLALTPLRLISSIAMIANDGKEFVPFVGKSVTDARGNIAALHEPKMSLDLSDLYPLIYEIKKGLRDSVTKEYGTAHLLNNIPMMISGKTGSAQIQNNKKTNAFFVGYAPAEDPKIAILVLIEDSKDGSLNTIPIAHQVFSWWYAHRFGKP